MMHELVTVALEQLANVVQRNTVSGVFVVEKRNFHTDRPLLGDG
jgi:hypothetical protein